MKMKVSAQEAIELYKYINEISEKSENDLKIQAVLTERIMVDLLSIDKETEMPINFNN